MKKKLIVLAICLLVIGLAIPYSMLFRQQVTDFFGETLVQTVEQETTIYRGSFRSTDDIVITATPIDADQVEVTFQLPYNMHCQYTVEFGGYENDQNFVKIWQDDQLYFDGYYLNTSMGNQFYHADGTECDFVSLYATYQNQLVPDDYTPSYSTIVSYATGHNTHRRGNLIVFFYIAVFLGLLAIDIKYPLFFFQLQHFMSVQDPEPTAFYLFMQRLNWYLLTPAVVVVLLIMGITI